MPEIDPLIVSDARLRELVSGAHEAPDVDYKQLRDLDLREHVLKLAVDVAALQSIGGYLVIGVDGRGAPTGTLTARHVQLLDEATVRDKIEAFIPPPLELRIAVHKLDDHEVVLLYVARRREGLTAMAKQGAYQDANGRQVHVFNKGDVFVRHGTKTERVDQTDIERVWAEAAIGESLRAIAWEMSADEFASAFDTAFAEEDAIAIRRAIARAPAEARDRADDREALEHLLDRMAQLAVLLVERGSDKALRLLGDLAERGFMAVYELALDAAGNGQRVGALSPTELWTAVVVRLYAIGGYAVRQERWMLVGTLVPRRGTNPALRDWMPPLVHWRDQATDAGKIRFEGERVGIQHLAQRLVMARPELRPDHVSEDLALQSTSAFDVLASLIHVSWAVELRRSVEEAALYGNAGQLSAKLVEPAIVALLDDAELRSAVFPHRDSTLRKAMQALLKWARLEARDAGTSALYTYDDWRINQFLEGQPSTSAQPLVDPDVVLGHPSFRAPVALGPDGKRYVTELEVRYLIENNSDTPIRDITTGVIRRDDGHEFQFKANLTPELRGGSADTVQRVSVPAELLDGLHESAVADSFDFWARFTDARGVRWRVVYDIATRSHTYTEE